jgi:hypothetical protein
MCRSAATSRGVNEFYARKMLSLSAPRPPVSYYNRQSFPTPGFVRTHMEVSLQASEINRPRENNLQNSGAAARVSIVFGDTFGGSRGR